MFHLHKDPVIGVEFEPKGNNHRDQNYLERERENVLLGHFGRKVAAAAS